MPIYGGETLKGPQIKIYGGDNLKSLRMKIHGGESTEMPIDVWSMVVRITEMPMDVQSMMVRWLKQMLIDENLWWWDNYNKCS